MVTNLPLLEQDKNILCWVKLSEIGQLKNLNKKLLRFADIITAESTEPLMQREFMLVAEEITDKLLGERIQPESVTSSATMSKSAPTAAVHSGEVPKPGPKPDTLINLRHAAEQENTDAQNQLGVMYELGRGIAQNYAIAATWYRCAADKGFSSAQFNLAALYAQGRGVPRDDKEAAKWYLRAAEQGISAAQLILGAFYAEGRGVPRDEKESFKWHHRSAELGNADAQCSLGVSYAVGQGVSSDNEQAAKWFSLAAEQGHARAHMNLGVLYVEGRGIPKNNVAAYSWFSLAASHANNDLSIVDSDGDVRAKAAQYRDHVVATKMTPVQIAEAQKFVREWKPK